MTRPNRPIQQDPAGLDRPPIPAASLLAALQALNDDPRLRELLGEHPVAALVVLPHERGFAVKLAPEARLAAPERALVQDAIADAISRVAPQVPGPPPAISRVLPDTLDHQTAVPPPDPRPHITAVRSHLDAGNPGRALELAEIALERWPHNLDLLSYRALALSVLGRPEEALAAYRDLIRRDPRSAFAYTGAASLSAKLGRWRDALAYANSALRCDPDDASALHVLALANEQMGLYREALQALRRALELDPTLPNGPQDLRRLERAVQEDVEVSLDAASPEPAPVEEPPLDLELHSAQLPPIPDQEPPAPQPEAAARSAPPGWGIPSRRAEPGNHQLCPNCQAQNPARVSFCIQCGRRLGA